MKVTKVWENGEDNIYYCNGIKIETIERIKPGAKNIIFSFAGMLGKPRSEYNSPEYFAELQKLNQNVEGYNLIGSLEDFDVVFIKDKFNDDFGYYIEHYHKSIYEEIKSFILSKIESRNYDRVITFGFSKGGLVSLLYGLSIDQVDEVFTVCPQIFCEFPFKHQNCDKIMSVYDYMVNDSYGNKKVAWYTSANDRQIDDQRKFIDTQILNNGITLQMNEVKEELFHNNIGRYFATEYTSDLVNGIDGMKYTFYKPNYSVKNYADKTSYRELGAAEVRELLYSNELNLSEEVKAKGQLIHRSELNFNYDFSQIDLNDTNLSNLNTLEKDIEFNPNKIVINLFNFTGDIEKRLSEVSENYINIIVNNDEHYKYIVERYITSNLRKNITIHKTDEKSIYNVILFLYKVLYDVNKYNNGKRVYFWKHLDRNQQHALMINYEKFNYLVNPFDIDLSGDCYKFEKYTPKMKLELVTSANRVEKNDMEISDDDRFSYITVNISMDVAIDMPKINIFNLLTN